MNVRQRVAIFVGLFIEAGMLLYPPWKVPDWATPYHLFSSPPKWTVPAAWSESGYKLLDAYQAVGVIDWQRLKIQCLIVGIVATGLVVLLGGKKPATQL